MIRVPTDDTAALKWHARALMDKALHIPLEVDYDSPQPGWYVCRVVRGGPFVPAKIFIVQDIDDETGELLGDETLKCEVNGRERDVHEQWLWLCNEPITEAAYDHMKAVAEYAKTWAPTEPINRPFQAVNWLQVPTPNFSEEKAK